MPCTPLVTQPDAGSHIYAPAQHHPSLHPDERHLSVETSPWHWRWLPRPESWVPRDLHDPVPKTSLAMLAAKHCSESRAHVVAQVLEVMGRDVEKLGGHSCATVSRYSANPFVINCSTADRSRLLYVVP